MVELAETFQVAGWHGAFMRSSKSADRRTVTFLSAQLSRLVVHEEMGDTPQVVGGAKRGAACSSARSAQRREYPAHSHGDWRCWSWQGGQCYRVTGLDSFRRRTSLGVQFSGDGDILWSTNETKCPQAAIRQQWREKQGKGGEDEGGIARVEKKVGLGLLWGWRPIEIVRRNPAW